MFQKIIKNNESFIKHKISLLSIFILGNTLIVFPKGIGIESAVISLFLSVIPTLLLSFLLVKSLNMLNGLNIAFKAAIILFSVCVFVVTSRDYISFVDAVRLPKTPRFIISFLFVGISLILGISKKKVLYLFSLFSLIITSLIIIIVFVFSANKISVGALFKDSSDFKVLIRQTLTFFIHSFGQILIPVFFLYREKSDYKKIIKLGLPVSFFLMIIYVLNIMLVLGSSAASSVDYPYTTLTSVVSFGRNFSRLDGFTYYIYFYSSLIKNAICVNVIIDFFKKSKKTATVILAAVLFLLCNIYQLGEFLKSDIANLIILIFEIAFPIVLFLYIKVKSLRKL